MYMYTYMYSYVYIVLNFAGGSERKQDEGVRITCWKEYEPAEPNRTEANRWIPEPAGTGRGNEPNRTGPSQDTSEKRRPNRVEPGNVISRTERNRTD